MSLAVTLRDKGVPLPAAILSVSPWYDMEGKHPVRVAGRQDGIKIASGVLGCMGLPG